MKSSKYISLLIKKLKGQLEPGEGEALQEWLKKPDQASTFREMEKVWERSGRYKQGYQPDVNQGFSRFQARIEAAKAKDAQSVKLTPVRNRSIRWISSAAAILLLGMMAYWQFGRHTGKVRTVQTLAQQKQTVDLPDGTKVVLNENSELSYQRNFTNGDARIVEFKGEAYFDITPNPDQPFIILTEEAEVKVLGTSFNLRAYDSEVFTEVEVESGKVEFATRDQKEKVVLSAKDRGVCVHGNAMVKKQVNTLNAQSWRTNELKFRNTSLEDILLAVERHYKIQIEESDKSILDCQLTFTFGDQDLADVIEVLEVQLSASITEASPMQYRLEGGNCDF